MKKGKKGITNSKLSRLYDHLKYQSQLNKQRNSFKQQPSPLISILLQADNIFFDFLIDEVFDYRECDTSGEFEVSYWRGRERSWQGRKQGACFRLLVFQAVFITSTLFNLLGGRESHIQTGTLLSCNKFIEMESQYCN